MGIIERLGNVWRCFDWGQAWFELTYRPEDHKTVDAWLERRLSESGALDHGTTGGEGLQAVMKHGNAREDHETVQDYEAGRPHEPAHGACILLLTRGHILDTLNA